MLFPILSTKQSGKVRWADDLLTCGKTLSTIRSQGKTNKKMEPIKREVFIELVKLKKK